MAWIKSHQELRDHPKTRRAARAAGVSIPTMVGHLHLLWHWALGHAPDGDLSRFEADDIADAAMWEGDPETLVKALISCGPGESSGFLEGSFVLHDWDEYGGAYRRRSEAGRKAADKRWENERNANADANALGDASQPHDGRNAEERRGEEKPPAGAEAPAKVLPFELDFAEAWKLYPRKQDRGRAFKAYQARRRAGATAEELLTATRNYAAARAGQEDRFTKLGATFYAATDDWRDALSAPTASGTRTASPSTPQLDAEEAEMRRIAGYDE